MVVEANALFLLARLWLLLEREAVTEEGEDEEEMQVMDALTIHVMRSPRVGRGRTELSAPGGWGWKL